MTNIYDYLNWRKDLSFDADPFNEVDSLVLACFLYAHFDGIIPSNLNEHINLNDAIIAFLNQSADKQTYRHKDDLELLKLLKDTTRFKDVKCFGYQEVYDNVREIQFCACTFDIGNHNYYVVYRGTDNFVAGWKEDLNLSFKVVPAQRLALTYLKEVIKNCKWRQKVLLGGHSKGGNLAVYAASNLNDNEFKKIKHIYNLDGPGFDFHQIPESNFIKLTPLMTTITPEMSFVASLMDHVGTFNYIESSQSSIMQHDPYSWGVIGKSFVRVAGPDKSSKLIKKTIDDWLKTINYDERQKVIDGVYELIRASDAEELQDILSCMVKNYKNVQKVYDELDPNTIKLITDSLSDLGSIFSSKMVNTLLKLLKRPSN